MILKECIMIYEMGYEISAGNHGRMHPNGLHEHGLRHERRYFGSGPLYHRYHPHQYDDNPGNLLRDL